MALCLSLIFVPRPVLQMVGIAAWYLMKEPDSIDSFEAEKRWGSRPFVAQEFRHGNDESRSQMVADLIRSHALEGLTLNEVKDFLGEPDGGYYRDGVITYRLISYKEKVGQNDQSHENWNLILEPHEVEDRIVSAWVQRVCCSLPPKWLLAD